MRPLFRWETNNEKRTEHFDWKEKCKLGNKGKTNEFMPWPCIVTRGWLLHFIVIGFVADSTNVTHPWLWKSSGRTHQNALTLSILHWKVVIFFFPGVFDSSNSSFSLYRTDPPSWVLPVAFAFSIYSKQQQSSSAHHSFSVTIFTLGSRHFLFYSK